ncbi:MAG: N-acetylmuramoyl-L-alanine amidase [Ilumatobacteraceae bacterium]|nr:N-acetylmuramoyl-L-alanine amidase [Ilumatobacteraceae bacterium]
MQIRRSWRGYRPTVSGATDQRSADSSQPGRRRRLTRLTVVGSILAAVTAVMGVSDLALFPAPANAGVSSGCVLSANGNGFGALTGSGGSSTPGLPPSTGNLKALMIYVDFSDAPNSETTSSLHDLLVPKAQAWQNEVSYGRFGITVNQMTGAPWLRMSKTSNQYTFTTFDGQRSYMQEALDLASAQMTVGQRQSLLDGLQLLYVVASNTTNLPNSPAYVGGSLGGLASSFGAIPGGATFGHDIRTALPDYGAWILAHETEHTLGLPDLYSFTDSYPQTHKYVGGWDHMGLISLGSHITAWQKLQLGWLDASQVPCVGQSGTFTLAPLETNDGAVKAIAIKTGPSTALVAENRQPTAIPGGQDKNLCDRGLLVYKVDASVATGTGPVRVQSSSTDDTSSTDYTNCGPLYNATFDARAGKSATYTDTTGATITVTSSTAGGNLTISVSLPPSLTTTTTTSTTTTPGSPTGSTSFVAVQPERLLETRTSEGQIGYSGAKPAAGQTVTLKVTGVGNANVPSTAVAVALNVTGVDATDNGFVTVYPCGGARPTASNLNLVKGGTTPNTVITKIGTGGAVCLYTQTGADLVADISGYFRPSTSFVAVQPERLLETRSSLGQVGYTGAKPGAGQIVHLQIAGAGSTQVPASATAAVLNITGVGATADGFVTAWPCDQAQPNASNLNLVAGATTPNLAIVKLSADGKVCLFTQGGADLLVDVSGYFVGASAFTSTSPTRLLDTRPPGLGYTGTKPAADQTVTVTAVDAAHLATTAAVVLNVTGVDATATGFVTVYPCGSPRPTASNLNLVAGATTPNLVLVRVGNGGTVCIYTQSGTDFAVDISGSFPTS